MTEYTKQLLSEIELFLADSNLSASYFGKAAVGNSELVKRLRNGGQTLPRTAERVRMFIEQRRGEK
jgi:hypothetical protein